MRLFSRTLLMYFFVSGLNGASAWADISNDVLRFSGFGTAAIDTSGSRDADWRATNEENSGVGRTTDRSASPDSLFAVQADSQFLPHLNGTLQVVSRQLSNGGATPYFEWANLQYSVKPNLVVRLGRLANNAFLYSESRDVGYVRLTIHLPDVYLTNSISNLNGGDLTYRFTVGSVLYKANFNYGTLNQSLTGPLGSSV